MKPSLRLLTLSEGIVIAEGSGVATVEFCNHGLQSVAKKQELYKQRAVGSVHKKYKTWPTPITKSICKQSLQ